MKKTENRILKTFPELVRPVSEDPRCLKMKEYIQHGRINTYDHCMDVARTSYWLGKKFRLQLHEEELVRGAFLHDYYLYDWHHHEEPWHGYTHPKEAAKNACRDFHVTPLEEGIIRSHMWPLTITRTPRSRIAWIVTLADKLCSTRETIMERHA